ncbi:hypothetical protein [Pseudonocardia aurantiaca]|uniref:CobW/HypB/UreG nucleotide-binding domain-containing protein n=1 Tax=Pseudonocardia aurantiaca TaxID=75290 RepID=A0ABW4FDV7_9PSEU
MTRPELLVLTGMHVPGVEGVISRIRALDPDTAVRHHDLRDIASGRVHRRLRRGRFDETTVLELEHGFLSCTLREDLLPQLLELAGPGGPRRVVLHLDPALEPEQVCWSLLHVLVDGAPVTEVVDLREIEGALLGALLTDAEVAAGEDAWRELPDPFGWWHTDPCETPADLLSGPADTEKEEH